VTVAEQRHIPRHATEWAAHYRLDARAEWRASRIIDVALDGTTLELYDATPDELQVGPLYLQIRSVADDAVAANVRAVLRNHIQLENGRVIALLQVGSLPRDERNLLQLLVSPRVLA
jgi:hypothetical protein